MKKTFGYLLLIGLAVLSFGCKQESRLDHFDMDASAPEQVSHIEVQSTPGGALITYQMPDDVNFSYVKAVYQVRPGIVKEVKSSKYTDTVVLVGFGDTLNHQVNFYSVGRNEKESQPVSVVVKPLTPPVYSVYDSIDVIAIFGGIQLSLQNPSQADLAVNVMMDTTGNNDWKVLNTFHTAALEDSFDVRGLEATEHKFGISLRDRWNNKSDTLIKYITPFLEEFIPKDTWSVDPLGNDQKELAGSQYGLSNIFDGYWDWERGHYPYASSTGSTLPQWFTIDLGVKVRISRIVEHQAPKYHLYEGSAVKSFELYGSNNPDRDGNWDSWTLLGTFHSYKPSGLPMGQTNDEDLKYANEEGESFGLDRVDHAYRFIRWKTLENYGGTRGQVVISELDVYGQIVH